MNNIDRVCPRCGSMMFRRGRCFTCGYYKEEKETEKTDVTQEEDIKPDQGDYMFCPQCGRQTLKGDYCSNCGFKLNDSYGSQMPQVPSNQPVIPPNLAPCPDCGNLVSMYATSCPRCGRPLNPLKTLDEPDNSGNANNQQPARSGGGCGTFLAVLFGILAAVWILSKILKIEITGTIIPIK